MDERQITDRVEGGRPEPGITTHPAAPLTPPAAPARRKWRWWMAIAIVLLMGGAAAFFRFTSLFIEPIRNFAFQAACAADRPPAGRVVRVLHRPALAGPSACSAASGSSRWRCCRRRAGAGQLRRHVVPIRLASGRTPPDDGAAQAPRGSPPDGARRDCAARRLPAVPRAGTGRDRPRRLSGRRLGRPPAAAGLAAAGSARAGVPSPWPATWPSPRSSAATRS